MASIEKQLLFLVPTPELIGPTSLCLCRKIVWVQDKAIFYAFSPLMKSEADKIMNFRVPVSASIVNGNNLLTSVDGKLVGVQQVLGHVVKPQQQSGKMHIQPNQLKQMLQAPILQRVLVGNKQTAGGELKRPEEKLEDIVKGTSSSQLLTPNPSMKTAKSENSTQGRKSVAALSSVSNNFQKTNSNKNTGLSRIDKPTAGNTNGPLKVKFPWNKAETNEKSFVKPRNDKCGNQNSGKDVPKKAPSSNNAAQYVLNVPKIKLGAKSQDQVEQDTAEEKISKLDTSAQTPKRMQTHKSLRVSLAKLDSITLKRLGCNRSSPLLLDIERIEKKSNGMNGNGIKKGRKIYEKPQRLSSLTQHPDFKHIPTTDKISFLKDLLKAQRSYLGL